jgi:NAD(P)-dependent dehydrogenase (short-subunit alcohol dehydrogenase family)
MIHVADSFTGAIEAFTYSLSQNLAKEGIRVNAVAPGPIWTPFIPATFSDEQLEKFGKNVPMGRAGQPEEVQQDPLVPFLDLFLIFYFHRLPLALCSSQQETHPT